MDGIVKDIVNYIYVLETRIKDINIEKAELNKEQECRKHMVDELKYFLQKNKQEESDG